MIPIYKPFLNGNESLYVNDCLESTWISSKGKYVHLFEDALKKYVGRSYASSCSNGTTALDLAFKAIGISKGDEVITSSFTYVASTNAILINNATPVFVDIENKSWNIDCDKIERVINEKTKAILISNIYGFLPDLKKIEKICNKHKIFLIEDAAESLGAKQNGIQSGKFGDISTFSFFGNKTITTGEGGMVLTDNNNLYEKIEVLKNQGNSKKIKYFHDTLGYNYRMTNIQAAIGLAQFEQLDIILKKKRDIFNYYKTQLGEKVQFQGEICNESFSSYWIVSILFDSADVKNSIIKEFDLNQIEHRPLFYPVDMLNFYQENFSLVNTKEIYDKGICLPSYPGLEISQLKKVCNLIKKYL